MSISYYLGGERKIKSFGSRPIDGIKVEMLQITHLSHPYFAVRKEELNVSVRASVVGTYFELMFQNDQLNCLISCNYLTY